MDFDMVKIWKKSKIFNNRDDNIKNKRSKEKFKIDKQKNVRCSKPLKITYFRGFNVWIYTCENLKQ